jgi:UDP-N-acetylglucosamine transferase subunit ALG13
MILVTVGTLYYNFDRLIRAVDDLAGTLDEEFVIQYGNSSQVPKNAKRSFKFTNGFEMESLLGESRIVISHAGAGTILQGLRMGKSMIIVPRLKKFHEHVDNHQLQLARILNENGKAIVVFEPTLSTLSEALCRASENNPVLTGNFRLISFLRSLLEKYS